MKRTVCYLFTLVAMCLVFTACGCEHQYEEKITTEASCTAEGVKTFTCIKCTESYTEEIPMVEHTYTSAVTKEPTCAEKGVTTFTCSVCSDSYTEEIEMIAHTLGEATVTKKPTCTELGEKTATCTVCQAQGVTEDIPMIEHSYKAKEKVAATCTEKGIKTLTCSGCDKTKEEDIPTIEHKYKIKEKVAATCIEKGMNTWACSMCDKIKEEEVKELGHNYKESKVITKVTCTSDGEVTIACTRCKDSYNEIKKATGHNWVDASCTKAKHCKNCNQTEGSALGHTTQSGKCARCNATISIASSCKLSVPSLPANFTFSSGTATITKCKGTFRVLGNGQLCLYLDINGTCGFTSSEGYLQTICRVVITNGTNTYKSEIYTGLYSGASFSDTLWFDGIEPGEYTLTFEKVK